MKELNQKKIGEGKILLREVFVMHGPWATTSDVILHGMCTYAGNKSRNMLGIFGEIANDQLFAF